MTKLTTLTGDIDARDLAQIRVFADRRMQGDTPTQPNQNQVTIDIFDPTAKLPDKPRHLNWVAVLVAQRGEVQMAEAIFDGKWFRWDNDDGESINDVSAWAYMPSQPQTQTNNRWTREDLIDALAEVIGDTHDFDTNDSDYARNVVDWIDANMTPIPEGKE